jgi:type IV pilus assembly protein PilA
MTSLNSRMQLDLINRKKGRNLLEKGFTLVELMIVIVIVGVLSAVALPNFLSQAGKAKGTEAKSQASAILKNIAAEWQQEGSVTASTDCTLYGAPPHAPTGKQKFNYGCSEDLGVATVVATANCNDESLYANKYTVALNLGTGFIETKKGETNKLFGGTNADDTTACA